jgi:hypothetical protein
VSADIPIPLPFVPAYAGKTAAECTEILREYWEWKNRTDNVETAEKE